ncbi:putative molybdopterin biosynthesis protein moeb protein [Phaeoacremonium minimum UCRPA7]|uniref:Putative molybdopterin biosynthesis protein moeb protein n=1 Tax=Phaeoacremonium minimum (strain UCR-PA7) TaxID=1286976 RepID=R8B9G0_PHAM7|nr:putative molybdopterin biosynthesis protein moeb protein [Phaeoacremonium minimum UCRPA7]EON95944.1 putative molybdopterin biosynthesis protein moeb protein [Phaeoacremonium minimum UCRPA7]
MSSFLTRAAENSKVQFAATAVVSGAIVAAGILGYQRLAQEERVSRLKHSIPEPGDDHPLQKLTSLGTIPAPDKEDLRNAALARRAQAGDFDDELILEQLARNRVFLGPEGLEKLRNSFVVVVGCGGVGSHCTAALARSGVSKIRLVDFDQVTLSSLNRHAVATLADVGIPKVQCLHRRLIAIAPWVKFDLRLEKFDAKSAAALLAPWAENGQKPDYVVDAIDNIDTKVALLKYCYDEKIPVISAMGAGTKSDPTRIVVGDIGTSTDDRLSRATRRRLKLLGVTSGIPIVFSTEKTGEGKAQLLPLPEEEVHKGSVGDLGVLPDFRVRILPVLGTMPAVFGYTAANHIILSITGYPHDYVPAKGSHKLYDSVHAALQALEEKLVRTTEPGPTDLALGLKIPLTIGDLAFLVEEIYRARSAITGVPTRLVLVRWRKPEGSTMIKIGEGIDQQRSSNVRMQDLVCMTKEEAAVHDKEVYKGGKAPEDLYDAETVKRVEARLEEIAEYEKLR